MSKRKRKITPGDVADVFGHRGPWPKIVNVADASGHPDAGTDLASLNVDDGTSLLATVGTDNVVMIRLERLIALVLGLSVEELRQKYHFQVFPDDPEDAPQGSDAALVVVVLHLEPAQLFFKSLVRTLEVLVSDLQPGAGIGALVQALWNEQQSIELGRRLSEEDPGQE